MSIEELAQQHDEPSREEMLKACSTALLNDVAVPAYLPSSQHTVYVYTDIVKREVRHIGKNLDELYTHVLRHYVELPEAFKLRGKKGVLRHDIDVRTAKELVDTFVTLRAEKAEVKPFAWPDEDCLTLRRLPCSPQAGPTPAWDEFLERLDNAEAFLAFVWSVFETQHRGRQALFLKGNQGRDGKSWVLELLADFMGPAGTTIDRNNEESRFGTSDIFDKRLLVYPDCTNPTFVNSQLFRNITGNDKVRVERKFESAFSASIRARLMIGANFNPITSSEPSNLSRLLIIGVQTTTKEQRERADSWHEGLKAELPALLHRAKEAYARLCPSHDEIAVPNVDTHRDHLEDAVESTEGRYGAIFRKHFTLDPKSSITADELHLELLEERWLDSDGRTNAFKRFMKNVLGITIKRVENEGKRHRIYVGLRVKHDRMID